jgi:hypothetical protein
MNIVFGVDDLKNYGLEKETGRVFHSLDGGELLVPLILLYDHKKEQSYFRVALKTNELKFATHISYKMFFKEFEKIVSSKK